MTNRRRHTVNLFSAWERYMFILLSSFLLPFYYFLFFNNRKEKKMKQYKNNINQRKRNRDFKTGNNRIQEQQ